MAKRRKYEKTGIRTKNPAKYWHNYYRKYRSGKPGRKRHGGGRK